MDKYYPLHTHLTNGSIGDSILKVSDYISKAKEYGVDKLAMTDHGSLSAIYDFYQNCIDNGIKPIIGMEAYVAKDASQKDKERWHLILIAKNEEGLRNLFLIHNEASTTGFYYRPRTDYQILKKYGAGIIGLSACVAGKIPQCILSNDIETAKKIINKYKECFDERNPTG